MPSLRKSLVNYLGLFLLLSTIIIFGASKLFTLEEYVPLRGEEFFKLFSPTVYTIYLYLLFKSIKSPEKKKIWPNLLFTIGIVVIGQGIAMNQTANYFNLQYHDQVGQDAYDAIYFYDEYLGHFLALFGLMIPLSVMLYLSVSKDTKMYKPSLLTYLSGIITGIVLFAMVIESQMAFFFLPVSALLLSYLVYRINRRKLKIFHNDLLTVFFSAFLVSMTLIALWGIYHGEFIEFSDLGWI